MRKRVRRRRFRWGDVQATVVRFSSPKIEKLRRHVMKLLERMPDDLKLQRLGFAAYTYFSMFRLAFKLEFDVQACEWVLNFADDPRGRGKRPRLGSGTKRAFSRVRTRAARARPGRKTTGKRILFITYKIVARMCLRSLRRRIRDEISPPLTRWLSALRGARDDWDARMRHWVGRTNAKATAAIVAIANAFEPPPCEPGARLEPQHFGEGSGLQISLYTLTPIVNWDAWLFGRPAQERERILA